MKKISKKLLALLLATLFVVSCFAGCSTQTTNEEETQSSVDAQNAKFGIVLQVENGAFTDMKDGIIEELKANGYEDAEFDYKSAQGDTTALSTILSAMDDGTYTAVFTVATPATQAFVNLESDTPCFFCAVSAPVEAGVITDMATPDKNATGTSNAIPTSDIIDMAYELTPNITKFGFIYSTAQVNAVNTVTSAKEYLDSIGVSYEEATVETSADVKSSTETLISNGCDVIFVPNDAVVQEGVEALAQVCEEEGIPTYCSSATTVVSGCLATLAIDDKGIGAKTADKCLEYLSGTPITEIPTEVIGIDYLSINTETAEALGIDIPDSDTIGYEIMLQPAGELAE